jgi:transcriptional regulator with XRE-family HTH domain
MLAPQTFGVKPVPQNFVWSTNPTKSQVSYRAAMDQTGAMALGSVIRDLRKKKGITQAEAAEGIGIARPTLTNIERGRDPPGRETLLAIAAYYGINLNDLIAAMRRQPIETPATTPEQFLELAVRHLGPDHGLEPAVYSRRLSAIQTALKEAHQAGKKVTMETVQGLLIDALDRAPDDPSDC